MDKINSIKVPLLSVVLPVFNCEKYLARCLDSITTQSIKNLEVIAIYDHSDDRTLKILSDYANLDPRIKIIQGSNQGLIKALNNGLDNAKGKYIARMDSDDVSLPGRFAKQIKLMDSNAFDICGGHYFIIGSSDEYLGARVVPCFDWSILLALSLNVPFAHGSVMFRSDFIKNNSIRYGSTKYLCSEDYALWSDMYLLGAKFCNINDWIFKYREHEVSLSKMRRKEVSSDAYKISSDFIKLNKDKIIQAIRNSSSFTKTREESENLATLIFIFLIVDFNAELLAYLKGISKRDTVTGFIRSLRFAYFKWFIR